MTLLDLISASARSLADAGVSFGHGTTNAQDEAAWLVLTDVLIRESLRREKAMREAGGYVDGDDEFEFSDDIPDDETPVEAVAPRFKPSHPKKPVPRKKGPGRFAKPKE